MGVQLKIVKVSSYIAQYTILRTQWFTEHLSVIVFDNDEMIVDLTVWTSSFLNAAYVKAISFKAFLVCPV